MFGSDWKHAFKANLLTAAIYCTPVCIAKPSWSTQAGFPPDETKIIPGSEHSALHLLMGPARSNQNIQNVCGYGVLVPPLSLHRSTPLAL